MHHKGAMLLKTCQFWICGVRRCSGTSRGELRGWRDKKKDNFVATLDKSDTMINKESVKRGNNFFIYVIV